MNSLIETITSDDATLRNRSLSSLCRSLTIDQLLAAGDELDHFRRRSANLYHRVRALMFLAALHRYHMPPRLTAEHASLVPYNAYEHLLKRRFGEGLQLLLAYQREHGPSIGLSSALAAGYRELGFQTLADQVRRSVRSVRGNQWMFRIGHPLDHPLRIDRALLDRGDSASGFPLLVEQTPVRMDFSHSGWSDIFFLGMDYPEGARVVNASIDLGVVGRDAGPRPPISAYLRVIDEPVLRLVSVDLGTRADIEYLPEVFDFARDYLGLLKAAVIAAGLIPPGMEGCTAPVAEVFSRMIGPQRGLEIVSQVNGIPKGSRLAVSTNLLGALIAVCMRATGQVSALTGGLQESDRRLVAARAILGEWLGGSGGGWQDSGGIWPGIKLIQGRMAGPDDMEHEVSRGCLLPDHHVLGPADVSPETRQQLQESLVLVHGGMAQNVGPILEMVTEKYLLREDDEWRARQEAIDLLNAILAALAQGDIRQVGRETTRNFSGPLQTIIPWATNLFTDSLIDASRRQFGDAFWGFWMLGGMSGGGMGFIFDPAQRDSARAWLQETLASTKRRLESALPFAMEPVVYDFALNDRGTWARLVPAPEATMPDGYYALMLRGWLRSDVRQLSPQTRGELQRLGHLCRGTEGTSRTAAALLSGILPAPVVADRQHAEQLAHLLRQHGFDRDQHEQIRSEILSGRLGLAQNRLSPHTAIQDVQPDDFIDARGEVPAPVRRVGEAAIARGEVGVVTLAAGAGSRWTDGAGVVKALHPFCQLDGRHRNFLEVHLAKTRQVAHQFRADIPHVFTTGYLTQAPIQEHLQDKAYYGSEGAVYLSPGNAVGLRMIPTVRDLRFAWEEMPQQTLDEQQQKVLDSLRHALLNWARRSGEAADYTDNVPLQCLHPVGHWYEVPNLLRNGTLARLLRDHPRLQHLMLHNVDTLGAHVDAGLLGWHIRRGQCLHFEVIPRRLDDRGGGLARVEGRPRLLEGLAMPREEDEFQLSFYNSMTTWIAIDPLLAAFGLTRSDLDEQQIVDRAVRQLARRLPTYITIKDVKKRWGLGQEDVFPVTQFERLWSDMTTLPEVPSGFLLVPLMRGQQLKSQAQLDGWLRDGSAQFVRGLCRWVPRNG
jgi:hypothetical protein